MAEKKGTEIMASEEVHRLLTKNRADIERVIPKHLNPERLLRVAVSAIARKKELQASTVASLLRSVMQAAILGLEIDVNGEAYLVPFYNSKLGKYEAQLIPGYKGLIKLARQSREVESIQAGIVLPGDGFDYDEGDKAFVKHRRALRSLKDLEKDAKEERDPNHLGIAWYSATWMRGARYPQVRVADPYEIESTRRRSKARDSGPWVTDYDAMGLKTVIRRAAKTWPASPNLSRAMEAETRVEMAAPGAPVPMSDLFPELDAIDVTPGAEGALSPTEEKGTVDKLAEKLGPKGDPKKAKDEPGSLG